MISHPVLLATQEAHSQALEIGLGTTEGPSFSHPQRHKTSPACWHGVQLTWPASSSGHTRDKVCPPQAESWQVSSHHPLPEVGSLRLPPGTAEKPTLNWGRGMRSGHWSQRAKAWACRWGEREPLAAGGEPADTG